MCSVGRGERDNDAKFHGTRRGRYEPGSITCRVRIHICFRGEQLLQTLNQDARIHWLFLLIFYMMKIGSYLAKILSNTFDIMVVSKGSG